MFAVQDEHGSTAALCLDCNLKLTQLRTIQNAERERLTNFVIDQAESATGIYGALPRFPERHLIQGGTVTLNNIKISNSNIGVLNTGNLEIVDSAVTAIREAGDPDLSAAFLNLSQAVISEQQLAPNDKNKILEVLSVISSEAAAPKQKRRASAIRPLLQEIATLASGAAGLAELFHQLRPVIEAAFR